MQHSIVKIGLFLGIILLSSCSGNELENAPHTFPAIIWKDFGFVIDEDNNLWQWKWDWNWEAEKNQFVKDMQKINMGKAHSITFARGEGFLSPDKIIALDKSGSLWEWSQYNPAKTLRKITLEGVDLPILKIQTITANKYAVLLSDGSIKAFGLEVVDFSLFKNIKEFYLGHGDVVLALDNEGNVFIAGNEEYLAGKTEIEKIVNPVQIKELSDIVDIEAEGNWGGQNSYYAIDKEGRFFYWGEGYRQPKPLLLIDDEKIKVIMLQGNTATTRDGNRHVVNLYGKMGVHTMAEIDYERRKKMYVTKGYYKWDLNSPPERGGRRKIAVIEADGTLNMYDLDPDSTKENNTECVTNPRKITDFKVNLNYFKK